ncbi:MAG: type II toxin-antitoxin system PemK/MazF family toxin [Ruminococcaceae bacterium]|nr:type II toxin-antitoxin system PemK/MazF family toxin [Oscillospiraceae bacterium]
MANNKRKIPWGRTLTTNDHYLGGSATGSKKRRPVVVIETNDRNELAVVPLSSKEGSNRTRMKKYQDGKSYFKHYVEIEDNEGKPIKPGTKFKENHPSHDVSLVDVNKIRDKVFYHSKVSNKNRSLISRFRSNKKAR